MPLPWLINNIYGIAKQGRERKRHGEGLDIMIENLLAAGSPESAQMDPMMMLLSGQRTPEQTQALIDRARAIQEGKGNIQAFDYLQQATDPAAFDARMQARANAQEAAMKTHGMQRQHQAHLDMLSSLQDGQTPLPEELQALTDPTYQAALGAQTPEDAGSTVLAAGGMHGQRGSTTMPSRVREYLFYQGLDKDQRKIYDHLLRQSKVISLPGGGTGRILSDGSIQQIIDPQEAMRLEEARIRGERIATALGDAQGAAMVGMPKAYETVRLATNTITALRVHPGLDAGTGLSLYLDPRNLIAGTDAHAFAVLAKQARGQVFAQAFETLKGGGPITEFESQSASEAMARLETAQSKPEFLRALDDYERLILNIYMRQRREAAGDFDAPADPNAEPTTITAGGAGGADDAKKRAQQQYLPQPQ